MKDKKTLRLVLNYVFRHRIALAFLIFFSFAASVSMLFIPVFVGDAIDAVVDAGRVDFQFVFKALGAILALAFLVGFSQWITSIIGNRITFLVVRDIRRDAFEKIHRLPLSYLDTHRHGDILSRIISDAEQFADGLLVSFTQLFVGITTIIGTFIFMLRIDVKITLAVVVLTPLSLLLTSFITKFTYSMFREQSEARSTVTSSVDEFIVNQKIVQGFNYTHRAQEKFDKANDTLTNASVKAIFFSSLVNPSTRVINNVVYAVVALFGAISVISSGMTVGGLTCFLSYAGQFAKPFNEISGVFGELQNSLACAFRLFEMIHEKEVDSDGGEVITTPKGEVDFQNASFSYDKSRPLIENLNLNVARGMRVAIVGPTGCGKTTLINLIMRFYNLDSGTISIDGIDIARLSAESLRSNIGMVLQDTWLKTGTISENIAFGCEGATQEQIVAAAKAAHAHNFIKKLPEGYDTLISNESGDLSQGQRQLLCISRLMLLNPDILILDEATSSIDTRTEMKIQDAFSRLMQGKTSFIVAHRLSTVRKADMILVMRDGKVVEQGTHTELLANNGFYAELYNSQIPLQ
jgi:ATP-binding cassette subfamily B protein